jgi:beta-lactamase superfamily II metal-dependent hydrolase
MGTHVVNVDLVRVQSERGKATTVLAWGDDVDVLDADSRRIRIRLTRFVARPDGSVEPRSTTGVIPKPKRGSGFRLGDLLVERDATRVLKVDFVDVQQGDGSVIETPSGTVVLVDGGDNQLFARYLAARFRGTSESSPKRIDCILVTHGDADHFVGLTEIQRSEKNDHPLKRLFIDPRRVYHNGLVKRPSSVSEERMLGATRRVRGQTIVTGLVADLRDVPDAEMNTPFRAWKRALAAYTRRAPIEVRNLSRGDDGAFDFLAEENVKVEVLGPVLTRVNGVVGLPFLGAPRTRFDIGHESVHETEFVGKSASHTINGHSIVLRLTYGDWRFLYAGDLNEQAERVLLRDHEAGRVELEADVFKVPHHGSADYSPSFLKAVAPVVSVVSSGDESARKEFIHPRATLMSALGRFGRGDDPLVFVTELVAFFEVEGWAELTARAGPPRRSARRGRGPFFAFSRAAFGIVKVRTDGKRLLVFTNSGQVRLKEAYAYEMRNGRPVGVPVRRP